METFIIDEATIKQLCKKYGITLQFQIYGDEYLVRIWRGHWNFAVTSDSFSESLSHSLDHFKKNCPDYDPKSDSI